MGSNMRVPYRLALPAQPGEFLAGRRRVIMMKARPGKEVVVKVRNEIGVLAVLSKIIAAKGINILAASAWTDGENGIVHLVTEDNLRTMDALRAHDYQPRELDVVLTEAAHKPGLLRRLTETLAKGGIDVHHLYATATADQDKALIVCATANNDRAIVLLNA
jgi:hypothetical protein